MTDQQMGKLLRKGRIDMHTFYEWEVISTQQLERLSINELQTLEQQSDLSNALKEKITNIRQTKEAIIRRLKTDPRSDDTIIM